MTEIIIRDLDEATFQRLQERARLHRRTVEEEIRTILVEQSSLEMHQARELADRIADKFIREGRTFDDSTTLIREERDR